MNLPRLQHRGGSENRQARQYLALRRFSGFLIKEFRHILRDRRSLLILFGMPVVQVTLFGFAITNELRNAQVAVLDQAHDSSSRALQRAVFSSGYFHLHRVLHNDAGIAAAFRAGEIKAVIDIPPHFERDLIAQGHASVQIIADASDPNTANMLSNYLGGIIRTAALVPSGAPPPQIPLRIDPALRMVFNPELKSVYMFVPGVMTIILMLVSAIMTSISIAREKEMGTMELLLVSPLNPLQVVVGKVLPYLLLAALDATLIVLLGVTVFGVPIVGSVLLLAAETVLFIVAALSLGILISTIADNQQTAMMISLMGLMMPTIILSGFIFPIRSLPWWLQILSTIIPARWFIVILKGIMLKGVGLQVLWEPTLVLAGMVVVLLTVSVKRYKVRLG